VTKGHASNALKAGDCEFTSRSPVFAPQGKPQKAQKTQEAQKRKPGQHTGPGSKHKHKELGSKHKEPRSKAQRTKF
jgi:hypothetical protein